jgi:membrane protein DedA with SNARE-associated domain
MLPAALVVFVSACLHEDVAILAAGFFVVEQGLSPWLAGVLAYAGMLTNNLTLYFLGAGMRTHPWVRRWLLNERAPAIRRRLERHLVATLTLSRLGQSMLTPALLGCGSLHIPLRRVLPIVALSAAVYLAVLLTLVIALGAAVLRTWHNWAWVAPLALLGAAVLWVVRRRLTRRRA